MRRSAWSRIPPPGGAGLGPGPRRVAQRAASARAQQRERIALAAGAVQREGQQPPGVLAPRMLGDVASRSGTASAGRTEGEPRLGPRSTAGSRNSASGSVRARPNPRPRFRVRGSPPVQRLPEARERRPAAGGQLSSAVANRAASTASGSAQRVSRPSADQQARGARGATVGFQRPAERGHEHPHGTTASGGGSVHRSSTMRATGTTRPFATISRPVTRPGG